MKTRIYKNKSEWLIPAGLVILSLVPIIAGAFRVVALGSSAEITTENARFFASPLPVVLHIFSVTLYALLGAFQFTPALRRRGRKWHRYIGRLLIPCGLVAALSGLWMTQFYPWPKGDGELLYGMRLVFGSAMFLSIILGVVAIRRKDYLGHGDWMMRGYAIGMGAGTQVFTNIPWFILFGIPDEFPRAMLMGAGWVINLAIAEWIIRRRPTRRNRTSPATA